MRFAPSHRVPGIRDSDQQALQRRKRFDFGSALRWFAGSQCPLPCRQRTYTGRMCTYDVLDNSDGTLTPELMAVNPESLCRTSKVATISHGPSVRHSHARWASGEGTDS